MLIITNPDAQILAAEAGELDILSDIARPSDIDRRGADPKLKMSLARGMHAFFLLLNNKNFPWDDAVVRRAAAMSIDRGAIVRMIFSGYCEPINSWLPPVSPWALANSSRDIYDPEGAAKLLAERGYTRDMTGALRSPDGRPFPKMKILTPLARLAPSLLSGPRLLLLLPNLLLLLLNKLFENRLLPLVRQLLLEPLYLPLLELLLVVVLVPNRAGAVQRCSRACRCDCDKDKVVHVEVFEYLTIIERGVEPLVLPAFDGRVPPCRPFNAGQHIDRLEV